MAKENENIVEENERFQMIIDALETTAYQLSKDLNYGTVNTMYRIKSGRGKVTNKSFVNKLIKRFPNVSYSFIMEGKLPVLLNVQEQIIQENFLESKEIEEFKDLDDSDKLIVLMNEIQILRSEKKEILNGFKIVMHELKLLRQELKKSSKD